MSTLHLVDPELRIALEAMPSFDFTPEILPLLREGLEQMVAAAAVAGDPNITVTKRRIPGLRGPDVDIIIFRPANPSGPLPAILDIHGGGYIIGSAGMMNAANQILAAAVDCVIVSVDYRLAPETPHPGPLEDCYAALKFLYDSASEFGVDATRIALSGQSAGAGLAAALALLARDRGEVPVVFQHLSMPMLDDRTCVTADPHPYTGEFVWTPASNKFAWGAYLGVEPGANDVSAYAAPARATELAGLPETFISIGSLDLFLEENLDYVRRLTRAGVPVEFHVYPGTYHGFQAAFSSRIVAESNRDSVAALKRALHPAATG